MAVPWLGIIDTVLDFTNLALTRRQRASGEEAPPPTLPSRALGQLETRLTGVVISALKEAFDRDASRLELEREQLERERLRAEQLLRLDLLRQTGDREIGRLRLMAGAALGGWVGTLLFSARLIDGAAAGKVMLGVGWVFLLAALSLSFVAQSRVSSALAKIDESSMRPEDLAAGAAGALVPWLMIAGLAAFGVGVLMA